MEKYEKNVVALLKENPDGIHINKLCEFYNQTYHENLAVNSLGFTSVASFVKSLKKHLIVEKKVVYYKGHFYRMKRAEASAMAKTKTEVLKELVTMVEQYPAGIPIKTLSIIYSQTFHKNLTLSTMGFDSITSLVASLNEDLFVRDELVYHKIYKHAEQPEALRSSPAAGGSRSSTPEISKPVVVNKTPATAAAKSQGDVSHPLIQSGGSLRGTPLFQVPCLPVNLVCTVPQPAQSLSQEQLYQRVLQVMSRYQLSVPSMEQLKTFYFREFGATFPLAQYMSVYDKWEANGQKELRSAQSESTAGASTGVPATPAAAENPAKEPEKQQQPPSLTLDDQSEFPELVSKNDVKAKKQKKKLKDEVEKDSAAPVFKDSYHAQLREVHGDNMRSMEAMTRDEDGAPAGRRKNRVVDHSTVNSLMEDVRREIAAEGELVTEEKVISRTCELMQVPSLDTLGHRHWKYQALKDLQYITREINIFIRSTEAISTICTLYELSQSLAGLKDKKHFEELNLGPLCKIPEIHRMFKIDSNTKDDDIQQIETADILKHLRVFRRQSSKVKVDLAEFLQYLTDQYNCESPYELGIRINSVALSISTLTKVRNAELNILDQAKEVLLKELEEETQDRLRKVKRSVLESLQGAGFSASTSSSCSSSAGNTELRKKYASMTAAEVVLEVFSNAEGVFTSRMTKHVQTFLMHVSGDRLATALFQLAICGGSLAVPQDLVPKDKTPKTKEQPQTECDKSATALPGAVKLKEFLKDSLSSHNSAVTLAFMASLERLLTKHFQVKDFLALRQGSFLEFLVKHVQLLQDSLGSTLFLGSGSANFVSNGSGPTKQDVFEFIKQCGDITSKDPDELFHIELALRSHYRVRDSRDLGYGTLQTLVGLVQRLSGLTGGGPSQVFYESALFAKHSQNSTEGVGEVVGRLGEVSKAQALDSLLSCPLLEDLNEWSQWELVFKPLHGPIKDFIERNAGNTGLAVLEVTPGLLLRITTHTGDKHFHRAVTDLDPVGTAGHLVSMVATDGIDNVSTALLANYMQSSLESAVAEDSRISRVEEETCCYSRVARFVLACLTRIPTRTCQALLQKVFLVPFSRAVGQAVSKQVLVSSAQSDPRHMNCLHRLGILLGITDWVKDYQKKLNPQQRQDPRPFTPQVDQVKSNLVNSASSSLSALNMSEEDYLEENFMDDSSVSSNLNQNQQPGDFNSEQDVDVDEEDDEEEQLFELAPVLNGEVSPVSNEAEDGEEEEVEKEPSEESVSEEKEDDSVAGCQSETTISPQRAVIEDIRKSEFGIGEELTAKGQKLIQKNQDRLGRSLERLSTELYSKDTHFVLELIQNADDNSYPSDAGVVPSLAFVVERDCITVLNNETGFQENNIRAVCDVGCSTKGKHKYGYIGQKGIGFKSVFKVTDCPEIHSNGFHIRFDRTSGVSLGYILPHWTEDVRPLEAQIKNMDQNSWTTKICLPLRAESHQTRNLFKDIHPSLLLFLHRLRSITICNQSENRLVTMTRRDLSHDVVEVEHTDGVERWLVVKTTLHPKQLKEEVESTELALAFQLCSDDTVSDIVCQPEKQPVFAYLPLRSFGFRFIVQADFDIPSSREDVDRDSCWNQWLRSELPQLFLQAMDVFTNHPQFCGLKGLSQFLQFIPLPDEVMDFFQRVAGQIITLLKGKAFLPTVSSDDEVVYKMPSQVAVCQDPVIREVINNEELGKHLSLSYLHPGLSPAPPKSLLKDLGVRYLGGSDVTTVTTAMAKELLNVEGIHSDVGLRQLARLLVCNFRALEYGYGESDSILQSLKDLPIIPLADGRVVSLSTEEVFFPMEETKKKKSDKKSVQTGPLAALYKDVSVVLPSLLNCVEPLESQQVRELLRRLGVHELEPQELLEQHIYPCIRNNKWKFKSEAVVTSYLVFIKQHSASSQEYSDIDVPVLTTRGLLCPGVDRVYFSEEYGNINLPNKLPGFDWTLLSPCYVQTDWDVAGWRELFSRVGVRDGFIIRKERKSLTAEELTSSPWLAESGMWHLRPGQGCVIDDYPCEEFHALVTAQLPGTVLLQQRAALLKLLASNWDTGHHYSQYLTAQVMDSDGRPIRSTASSFSHHLSRLKWVPTYRVLEGDQEERTFLCPNSVYLTSPEVTNLLGSHVYYVDIESSEFTRALGMRQSISVEAMINYLKEWCLKPEDTNQERSGPGEAGGAAFTTTVQHIHNVYTYLQKNCSQSSLKELFQHTPAVFIEYNRRETGWCSGRFYHLKEVCWSDTTKMFQRYKQLTNKPDSPLQEPKLLAPFYNPLEDMKDFFIRLLNVDRSPNMKQYVGLLELLCSSAPIPTTEVLQDVSLLFARLAQKCKVQVSVDPDSPPQYNLNPGYCSTLKGMVSDMRVFPTKDNSWVTLKHKPMIPDNKELEKIFKSDKQVCLLNLPPPTEKKAPPTSRTGNFGERTSVPYFIATDRLLFMEICGVRSLSHCVKSEAQTENLRPCASMQDLVRSMVPYIQRFLYRHEELSHVYSELVDENIKETIRRLQFGQVGKLYIRYQLDVVDSDTPLVEMQDVICLLKDRKELYIQKDHLDAKLDICRELVKLFCTESSHRKELVHFLTALITSLNQPAALKRLKEEIRELPSDEEQWEVPEPPRPEVHLERISRVYSSTSSVEEPARPVQEDGEPTLACWPPRAPMHNSGGSRGAAADGGVVDAVMQKWPPPASPKDRGTEKEASAPREGGHVVQQSPSSSSSEGHQAPRGPIRPEQTGTQRVLGHPGQPPHPPHPPHPPGANLHTSPAALPPESDPSQPTQTSATVRAQDGGEVPGAPGGAETSSSAPPAETVSHQQQSGPNSLPVPEAVVLPGTFQGTADSQRPPLNLDFPLWNKVQPPQETLEDMTLNCQRPTTVVLSDDQTDVLAIGEWGEELVYSFLCHWRDSGEPGCPTDVLWCNQSRESGLPYDFKLSFTAAVTANDTWTYVEVKSTIKKEKAFIHLSVKELDFALREKEHYHVYRVYSAGDANNVRLCRIQNLAQHLYTKELGLYLFV